jgi:excisionase family DNA binding protein
VDQLLTLKTIAEKTQTSEAYWRKAIARRLLPATRIGRAVRVRESVLLRFLEERERPR